MTDKQHVGITSGKFSVTKSGQSAYHIPIKVPPGTARMEPSIALSYVGNQRNGLLGVGFTLSGLPSISRTGQTMAQDQKWTAVNYSADDRFTLAGERLIAVQGSDGADGTEYRTERESWARIISHGDLGGGPEWFEVTSRSGRKLIFGNDASARVPALNGTAIRTWALNRVTDLNGNYYTVSYELDEVDGTHRPLTIEYTGNDTTSPVLTPNRRVIFSYEDRSDPVRGYSGGHAYTQTKRLKSISTYLDDQLVRTYQVGYREAAVTARSELVTIVESDGQGIALPTLTLTRPDETTSWWEAAAQLPVVPDPTGGNYVALNGDLTGDGRTDLVIVWEAGNEGTISYAAFIAQEDGTFAEPVLGSTPYPLSNLGPAPVDIKGTGRTDLISFYNWNDSQGNQSLAYSTFIWENNKFTVSDPVFVKLDGLPPNFVPQIVPVDVNGDGKSELFIPVQSESGTMSYHLLVWDGQSYTRQSGGDTSIPMVNVYMPMLMAANITGTPLQDIVCGSNADVMEIYTLFSNGSGFEAPQEPLKLAYGGGDQDLLIPIDTTGDGLTDFAFVWRHRGKTQLTVLVSDGTKITEPVPALLPIDLGDVIPSLSPVDLTGDRRTDLLLYTLDGFENSVVTPLLARNGSFVVQPSIATNLDVQPWAITTPDVKGVGRNDLLITAPAGENLQFNVYRSAASNLGLVKSISNGIGGEIAITYLPATDSRVYSESATPNVGIGRLAGRSSAATIPAVQMAASGPMAPSLVRNVIEIPLNLVWRVERSDGLGQSYVKESLYEDGLVSLEGRGWLGFAKTTVTDLDTSSTLETTYRQDFPFTSQVHTASRGWAGETQALRTRSYQYEVKNPTSPRVYVTQLQQRVTTVNSDFLGESSSQTSIHGYDDFGNRLTTTYSSPQAGPSADVFITRTFDNDTTNWCLGLMRSSVACADAARKQVLRRRDYTYYPATKQLETSSHWNSTDPDDSPATTLSYDNFGNVESVASSSGALTTLTFEPETAHTYPKTRTRKASDGTNLVDTFTYDLRFGVWTTHQDANGNVRRRTFDDLGRVKDVFVPGPSGEVQFQHTDRQLQPTAGYTKTTSQLRTWDGTIHRVTTRYFDGLARRYSTMRQAEGGPPAWQRVVQSQLDSRGRSKSRSLPFLLGEPVLWTKTTFDPLGRVIERIRPINQSEESLTKIWYLGLDRITVRGQHSPDAVATIERRSFYNGKPKVVQRADGLGQLSTFDFDQLGRLKTATPPAGTPQSVQYDSVNTPFLIEGSDFGQVKNQVQFAKRRKIMTYANGQNIQVTLDYLNRPVEISLSDGSSYVMGYDVAGPGNRMGRLATVTATRAGSTLYSWLQEYDKLGRRTSLQLSIDGSTYTQQRSHYPSGRIEEITFQDTTKAKYSYDGLGQIRELTFITADGKEHAIATYGSYNAFGRPQTGAAGNGIGKRWSYTVRGQIKQQEVLAPGANGAVLFSRLFGRDTFGRLLSVTDTVTGKLLDHYDYDQAGQLRTWTDSAGSQHQLEFDPTGNIKSTGTRNLSYEGSTITVTPNGGDAYTLTYDVSGNRATRTNANGPDSKFAYDSRNLLIAVDGTSFLYNHRGRRLVKASSTGGRTVYLTSDDIISSGASVKLLRDPYGVAAVVETPTGNAPQRLYFLDRDQVNSTVLISDQSGAVLAAPRYEPFGRLLNPTTGLSPYLPGFGGQQFDVETGLAYFNARYYDPEIGRFITVDSKLGSILTGTNSLNRFAFALNNPINLADPSGHGLFDWLFSAILDLIEIVAGAIAGYFGAEPLAGALIGAGVSGLVYEGGALASGQSFSWAGWGIAEGIGAVTGLFGGIGAGGAAGEAAAEVAEEGVAGGLEIGEEAAGSESSEGENFSQSGDSEPEGGWDPSEELNSASDDDDLYRGLRDLLPEHIEGPDLPDDVPPPPPPGEGGPMMEGYVEWDDDEFSTSDDSWDDGDDVPHNNNDGPAPPGPPRLWPPPPPGAQFGLALPDLPDLDMSLDSG